MRGGEVQGVRRVGGIADAEAEEGAGWNHIFVYGDETVERLCRFAYDTEEEALVAIEISRGPFIGRYESASVDEIADVEDSLKNANPDAIDNPDSWGLISSNELPEWCVSANTPKM